jgi:xylulose-5-phosphate/fructose-6-phosphate phosphoketolase
MSTLPAATDSLTDEERSHQVPLGQVRQDVVQLAELERWLRSYRPEELFDAVGARVPELRASPPAGVRRMSANPHANVGELPRDLVLPDFRRYGMHVTRPGGPSAQATRVLGAWLRDVMAANPDRFRLFGPDEVSSNRLDVIDRVPGLGQSAARLRQEMMDARQDARDYTRRYGQDDPRIQTWSWPG